MQALTTLIRKTIPAVAVAVPMQATSKSVL